MYTLDNYKSAQLVTNFLLRARIQDRVKDQYGVYDEYDIQDGDTPEIIADKVYGNPELHWLVLLFNDIIDPHFDWPLTVDSLDRFITGKYGDTNAIDHYEDIDGNIVNGILTLQSSAEYDSFTNNTVITNITNTGTGVVTNQIDTSYITITVTEGGFKTGDQIKILDTDTVANITSISVDSGVPVTVYQVEDGINETKRRIRLLKPRYADSVVSEFSRTVGAA